ncbi:carotenoid ester lipase precursor, partial [Obba rivulosa]
MPPRSLLLCFTFCMGLVGKGLSSPLAAPTVFLDQGTFNGQIVGNVEEYLGIPFAQPPVGNLRFQVPQQNNPYNGTFDATQFGSSCPGNSGAAPNITSILESFPVLAPIVAELNALFPPQTAEAEDCLTLNVYVPTGTTVDAKLPIVAWIYGGEGFVSMFRTHCSYPGANIVQRSIQLGEPIIYVSMNYRQEVMDAKVGNLGLRDQRQALRWIQQYINFFGGDPMEVTIWGESAGSWSVANQMLTNGGNTEGLFRAAFMESGSALPFGSVVEEQTLYDALVAAVGCAPTDDTLECLREVPYAQLQTAIVSTEPSFPQAQNVPWQPRIDGDCLVDSGTNLVQQGSVANIPFINGDCDDEGTIFGIDQLNITTSSQLAAWLPSILHGISETDVSSILGAYPDDVKQGSPFNTGVLNAVTPEYKRISALQGDLVFQAPRRFVLQQRSGIQPTWSYLYKRMKLTPVVGSAHTLDLLDIYGPGNMTDYLINFV